MQRLLKWLFSFLLVLLLYNSFVFAAGLGLHVLRGEEPGDIPVTDEGTKQYMFDWCQLGCWGISVSVGDLLPGAIGRFKESSFWELDRWRIIGVIALCFLQALLIIALLIQRARRSQAENNLRDAELRYRTVADFTYDWEYWEGPDGTLYYSSPSSERITGYRAEQFIDNPDLIDKIILPEDRRIWTNHHHDALVNPGVREIQFRIRKRDGKICWIEHACQQIVDGGGQFMGFRASNRDITKRKNAEMWLRKNQEDYRMLAGKLLTVQEAERQRLAREMHDDLTQRLAVLAIEAGKLEQQLQDSPDPILEKLREMREQMVKLSADVHAISRQLHPSILDDLGLVDAVKSECTSFTHRERIVVKYKPNGVPVMVPKDVALCIYRIIQEGLRNIGKHARATEVHVSLIGRGVTIHLSIEDNGIGFDLKQADKKAGLGLLSMKERVRLIRGEMTIKTKPGQGTAIKVRVPLSAI